MKKTDSENKNPYGISSHQSAKKILELAAIYLDSAERMVKGYMTYKNNNLNQNETEKLHKTEIEFKEISKRVHDISMVIQK